MKKKFYLITSILILLSLISSAAVCNLGSLGNIEISDLENAEDNDINESDKDDKDSDPNTVADDPSSSNNDSSNSSALDPDGSVSNESSSNSGSDNSGQNNSGSSNSGSNDNKDSKDNTDKNSPPVINSISYSSDVFLPNKQYTLTCDVFDPDNDPIYYEWSVDGGTTDNFESPSPVWTTPSKEGVYIIELRVSDGWGGYDTKTEMVTVGNVASNAPPVINYIAVYPDGPKYTDNTYEIYCNVTDPNSAITAFDFVVTGGILHDQNANYIKWDTPSNEGTYTITVSVHDKEGNLVTGSESIYIESEWIGVADIIVRGGDIITTDSSYNVEATIVDPKEQISNFEWSTTGGQLSGQIGRLIIWDTPSTPGTYTLTLKVSTLSGDTYLRSEDFTVVSQ